MYLLHLLSQAALLPPMPLFQSVHSLSRPDLFLCLRARLSAFVPPLQALRRKAYIYACVEFARWRGGEVEYGDKSLGWVCAFECKDLSAGQLPNRRLLPAYSGRWQQHSLLAIAPTGSRIKLPA